MRLSISPQGKLRVEQREKVSTTLAIIFINVNKINIIKERQNYKGGKNYLEGIRGL